MEARLIRVQGRVQGVGYRYFAAREALALALAGWVRNLADGSVEILAAGEAAALDVFEGRLWAGPPLARVSSLSANPAAPPDSADFRIVSSGR